MVLILRGYSQTNDVFGWAKIKKLISPYLDKNRKVDIIFYLVSLLERRIIVSTIDFMQREDVFSVIPLGDVQMPQMSNI